MTHIQMIKVIRSRRPGGRNYMMRYKKALGQRGSVLEETGLAIQNRPKRTLPISEWPLDYFRRVTEEIVEEFLMDDEMWEWET